MHKAVPIIQVQPTSTLVHSIEKAVTNVPEESAHIRKTASHLHTFCTFLLLQMLFRIQIEAHFSWLELTPLHSNKIGTFPRLPVVQELIYNSELPSGHHLEYPVFYFHSHHASSSLHLDEELELSCRKCG